MTYSFSGGAGWLTDDPKTYGSGGVSQGSLSGESPERLELSYESGQSHRMAIRDWGGAFKQVEVEDISPEGWGGAEGTTSLMFRLKSTTALGLFIRQVVQADTGTYKYELFTTDILGADDDTDLSDSTFTFSKTAEKHDLRIITDGTTFTLEVDEVLEASIATSKEMNRVYMLTTDHSSANTIRYGKVAIGSGASDTDRVLLNVVMELPPISNGENHSQAFEADFNDVNDWASGGALNEGDLDYLAGNDFSEKHQSYNVDNYTPVGDKQAMIVVSWQGVDHASKTATGRTEISDGTSDNAGVGVTIAQLNRGVIGIFDKDPGGAVWTPTAFGLVEIGWRANQDADAVNCECFAIQGEVYDFDADPPPTPVTAFTERGPVRGVQRGTVRGT